MLPSVAANALRVTRYAFEYGPDIFCYASAVRNWINKRNETNNVNNNVNNNDCPVCNKPIIDDDVDVDNIRIKLPLCKHSYHLKCLNYMREIQSICAICEIDISPVRPESYFTDQCELNDHSNETELNNNLNNNLNNLNQTELNGHLNHFSNNNDTITIRDFEAL